MKRILQAFAVVCLVTLGACAQGTNQYGSLSAASTDCAVASQCVTLQIPNNTSSVAIDLDGTFVATLQFESQGAPGGTWRAIKVTPIASTTTVSSATAVGSWRVAVAGLTAIRVRPSAYVSGPVLVNINPSPGAASLGGNPAFSSGGVTADVVPESDGAGSLRDSPIITDNAVGFRVVEGAAPSGVAGSDVFYADSTLHGWKMLNNNGSALQVMGSTGVTDNILCKFSSGNCVNSAFTDDAVKLAGTIPIRLADGLVSAASYSFTSASNTGLFFANSGVTMANGGNELISFQGSGIVRGVATMQLSWTSGSNSSTTAQDTILTRGGAAATIQLGAANLNGTPVNQTLRTQGAVTGTDLPGGQLNIFAGPGTGAGATSQTSISRALMGASAATVQSTANAITVCESKTLSNTSATTTTFATIGLASNSGGGASVTITLVASDGTNFDAETQTATLSFVNKATVMTVSTPVITASSASNNSGSATIGFTATGASPTISLKVTPVYGTIVPTTVTMYAEIMNHGAGAVSCQ